MPTISIPSAIKDQFIENYTDEEFANLLFDYGLEVDDICDNEYRIDIPANRHDILCYNGILQALNSYLKSEVHYMPNIIPADYVIHNSSQQRPFIACAIIKGIDLDENIYNQFIDYQDKLHLTLGRNRSIVSIGTHDLDTIVFPVRYADIPADEINFIPLNSDFEVSKSNMQDYFTKTSQYYVEKETYPVVKDERGILSLVPIINSDRTKIKLTTRNIFIEVTGTDINKVNAALKLMIHNFRGSEVLSCSVNSIITPEYNNQVYILTIDEINSELGLSLTPDEIHLHLLKMMHSPELFEEDGIMKVRVCVPDNRCDIMHKVDIIEDVAVSYGFNNFKREVPAIFTIGSQNGINQFCDRLRHEFAIFGCYETLNLILESRIKPDQLSLLNYKSSETECVRYSLIPGLLKAMSSNKHHGTNMKIFECGDVVIDQSNVRKIAVMISSKSAKFEDVQGIISSILAKCSILDFAYEESDNDWYIQRRSGIVKVGDKSVGHFGILKPSWCNKYKVGLVCSVFELDVAHIYEAYVLSQTI